jgi:hypothetical protein
MHTCEHMTDADKQACPVYSSMLSLSTEQKQFAEMRGSAGQQHVYRGIWKDKDVAITYVAAESGVAGPRALMLLGRHPHIETLFGISTEVDGSQSAVTELAALGSMHGVVRNTWELLCGMEESSARMLLIEILTQVSFVHAHVVSHLFLCDAYHCRPRLQPSCMCVPICMCVCTPYLCICIYVFMWHECCLHHPFHGCCFFSLLLSCFGLYV